MKKHTILVLDDDPLMLEFMQEVLYDAGYRVVAVQSVDEAIRELQSHPSISLILCDINLPGRSGFDFMRFLGDNLRFSDIPVMFVTGDANASTVVQALELGARDYVSKPFTPDTLLAKVAPIIEAGRGLVLVASDDDLDRNIIVRSLTLSDYFPLVAINGTEAKALLAERQVDVLITEMALPDLPELELLMYSKEHHPRLPVIVIQRHPDQVAEDHILAAGADATIKRPFRNTEIISKVDNHRRARRNGAVRQPARADQSR